MGSSVILRNIFIRHWERVEGLGATCVSRRGTYRVCWFDYLFKLLLFNLRPTGDRSGAANFGMSTDSFSVTIFWDCGRWGVFESSNKEAASCRLLVRETFLTTCPPNFALQNELVQKQVFLQSLKVQNICCFFGDWVGYGRTPESMFDQRVKGQWMFLIIQGSPLRTDLSASMGRLNLLKKYLIYLLQIRYIIRNQKIGRILIHVIDSLPTIDCFIITWSICKESITCSRIRGRVNNMFPVTGIRLVPYSNFSKWELCYKMRSTPRKVKLPISWENICAQEFQITAPFLILGKELQ